MRGNQIGKPLELQTVIDTIPSRDVRAIPDGAVQFVNLCRGRSGSAVVRQTKFRSATEAAATRVIVLQNSYAFYAHSQSMNKINSAKRAQPLPRVCASESFLEPVTQVARINPR